MAHSAAVEKLANKIAEFAESRLGDPQIPRSSKVIHDALWGTQRLHQHEVAFLNTPLLQRLRRLHQTGFSFLTYPSTTHTRFEHSLGVLYQTDRLARSLNEKYPKEVPASMIEQLRVAALLHDCSHGPFSHTSEEIYSNFSEVEACIGPMAEFEGASASELLAHFILTSAPFAAFLKKLNVEVSFNADPKWLSEIILGRLRNADPLSGHLNDIINGPFDADKLDYIFRDGHYSGLPLGVDLDRLWYATQIHVIKPGDLAGIKTEMRRLVMARSGTNSLEQIVSSRMNLTASLYHHHKVRATDCMFKGVLLYCYEQKKKLCGRVIEDAADFLYMTDFDVLADAERNADPEVREILSNIVDRRLLKRALVITMNSFKRPQADDDEETEKSATYNLLFSLATASFRDSRRIAELIWKEAGSPCRKEEVWVDFPKVPKMGDLARTFVNVGSEKSPEFRTLSDFMPLDQWGKQYLLQKWRGHVFCPAHCLGKISSAAKEVLEAEYKVAFERYAWTLCNLTPP